MVFVLTLWNFCSTEKRQDEEMHVDSSVWRWKPYVPWLQGHLSQNNDCTLPLLWDHMTWGWWSSWCQASVCVLRNASVAAGFSERTVSHVPGRKVSPASIKECVWTGQTALVCVSVTKASTGRRVRHVRRANMVSTVIRVSTPAREKWLWPLFDLCGWMDGRIYDGWMNGWMDRWMD